VQEISHLHGGRVEIKEATFGPGTRVIVYLPATDDETAAKKTTR
jgi:hypothetical protein